MNNNKDHCYYSCYQTLLLSFRTLAEACLCSKMVVLTLTRCWKRPPHTCLLCSVAAAGVFALLQMPHSLFRSTWTGKQKRSINIGCFSELLFFSLLLCTTWRILWFIFIPISFHYYEKIGSCPGSWRRQAIGRMIKMHVFMERTSPQHLPSCYWKRKIMENMSLKNGFETV